MHGTIKRPNQRIRRWAVTTLLFSGAPGYQRPCPAPLPSALAHHRCPTPNTRAQRPAPVPSAQRPCPAPSARAQRPCPAPSARAQRPSSHARRPAQALQRRRPAPGVQRTKMHRVRKRPTQRIRGCPSHHFTFRWSARRPARANGDRSLQRA